MDIQDTVSSQYHAALAMFRQAVVNCPPEMWNDPAQKNRFWHVAYHALFYTHLYLMPAEADFVPWSEHRDEYQYMGPTPYPPHNLPKIDKVFSQAEVLAYLDHLQGMIDETVARLDWKGESGFYWVPVGKLELQFYSIRHLQHHAGELSQRLMEAGVDVEWVGKRPEA